jgi:hypothetical protein
MKFNYYVWVWRQVITHIRDCCGDLNQYTPCKGNTIIKQKILIGRYVLVLAFAQQRKKASREFLECRPPKLQLAPPCSTWWINFLHDRINVIIIIIHPTSHMNHNEVQLLRLGVAASHHSYPRMLWRFESVYTLQGK